MRFGEVLKTKRKEKKLTQKELGEKMGIDRSTISQYEAESNREPALSKALRLSRHLDFSLDNLSIEGECEDAK